MEIYADVLLPLRLAQYYTYIIPESCSGIDLIGKRVIVPLGAKKYYAGIVVNMHNRSPKMAALKLIEDVLDEQPIISQIQIDFWKWLADYYMCTIGEIMEAALPNYFKLSSERFYQISIWAIESNGVSSVFMSNTDEEIIYDAIRSQGQISLKEIKENFGNRKGILSLNKLIDTGLVEPIDVVKDKYKARFEKYLRIHSDYYEHEKLNVLFSQLSSKSKTKYKILLDYFTYTQGKDIGISKSKLIDRTQSSSAVINSMIEKSIFEEYVVQIDRFTIENNPIKQKPILSESQSRVYTEIQSEFQSKQVVLLRGITGSGKTEIYISLIQSYIEQNKFCLFILPEIALTQQIVSRLNAYFGSDFVVYHSMISHSKRYEIWKKVKNGEIKILIGTRSSIFLPFQKLDLVVIDEEHDSSLKQSDQHPKFHVRDAAIHLAQKLHTKILLASATPSIESYFNALSNKFGYVELLERYAQAKLPQIEIINLRETQTATEMLGFYSKELIDEIKNKVNNKEQVILFQNRRGYSPYIQCHTCGHIRKCDHCDVRLTYHTYSRMLVCHYCNKKYAMNQHCVECNSVELRTRGLGTQKVEEDISLFLPEARIARLDIDAASSVHKIESILHKFKEGEFDVLIGTQMVSKGLDFENLTLVGVVQADIFFSHIDYKTDEKAFQLLNQVSGRVGRGKKAGKVMIQTTQPENKVIQYVLADDWKGFITEELKNREKFIYPPYCKLMKIVIKHIKEDLVSIYADKISKRIAENIKSEVIGPTIPPITRIRNQYLREIYIKLAKNKELQPNKNKIREIIDSELMTLSNKNFSIDIIIDA